MRRKTIILLLSAVILFPGFAGAVSEKDFELQLTENIINLCTAAPDDPLYHHAINFCHGDLVGAYHYHEAAALGPAGIQLVCAPDPKPSRNDTIDMFIDWAKPVRFRNKRSRIMPKSERRKSYTFDRPGNYRIRVQGFLDESWSDVRGQKTEDRCQKTDDRGPVFA